MCSDTSKKTKAMRKMGGRDGFVAGAKAEVGGTAGERKFESARTLDSSWQN